MHGKHHHCRVSLKHHNFARDLHFPMLEYYMLSRVLFTCAKKNSLQPPIFRQQLRFDADYMLTCQVIGA